MTYNVFSGTLNPTHFTSLHYGTATIKTLSSDVNAFVKHVTNIVAMNI